MSFSTIKSWDNRTRPVRLDPKTGRSWTRRIRWMVDGEGRVKLKMEDGQLYKEVLADQTAAVTIWGRFREGQSIDDSVSILANPVPKADQSKKASRTPAAPHTTPEGTEVTQFHADLANAVFGTHPAECTGIDHSNPDPQWCKDFNCPIHGERNRTNDTFRQ